MNLTLEKSALIACVICAPSALKPRNNPEGARGGPGCSGRDGGRRGA